MLSIDFKTLMYKYENYIDGYDYGKKSRYKKSNTYHNYKRRLVKLKEWQKMDYTRRRS